MIDMKIVAFGDSRYKRVASNWAAYLQSHEIDNYTIYALDQDIFNFLNDQGINTELTEVNMFSNKKQYAWNLRFECILKLLNDGSNILHSDLDAIWLRDPLEFISNEYDIVSSTGHFPGSVNKIKGYTLCMGWIYYKSCDIVKKIFNNILHKHRGKYTFDDQMAFNEEIFLTNNYKDLKINPLNQDIISRDKCHTHSTYVAHPLSPKNIDREQFLKDINLWVYNK